MASRVTYTVKWGDTLTGIAEKYKSQYGTTVNSLVKLNNIEDPDFIVVGQVLVISGDPIAVSPNRTYVATVNVFGLQSGTDRTLYAAWSWDKSNTENYKVRWYYDTGDGIWFVGTDSTTTLKQSTYSAPENAKRVRFKVKPVSKAKSGGASSSKTTYYWKADWSVNKDYSFGNPPPAKPSTPSISVDKYKLTMELNNISSTGTPAKEILFEIVANDKTTAKRAKVKVAKAHAAYTYTMVAGQEYKVRCQAFNGDLKSEWSDYSDGVKTMPGVPGTISICRANSPTSVYLEWDKVYTATSYGIEYTTKRSYFDGSDQTTVKDGIEPTHFEVTGLTSGEEYFFRMRSTNENGTTGWSNIVSVKIGTKPAAPTTWSSTTTAVIGEDVTLYWVHNSEDGSKQVRAEVELDLLGTKETVTVGASQTEDYEQEETYSIKLSSIFGGLPGSEGSKIKWRVRTAGITEELSDWSIERTIDVYAPPSFSEFSVIDSNGVSVDILSSLPFRISASAGPSTQAPTGYHVTITSNEEYEDVDDLGNEHTIVTGQEVYSEYFDTSDPLSIDITALDVDLKNNISYTVTCVVSMNSGLTAETTREFTVAWSDVLYSPNAEVTINEDDYTATIRPHCENESGTAIAGVTLSVYRREFDGHFTEIMSDIQPGTSVVDPHPALDYARYRIVARHSATGAISYYDIPGIAVGCTAIIIQWDESWSSFEYEEDATPEQPPWSGSLLKLPYNVDVSDNHDPEVSLVKYIGRERPVSYYGTQLGESSTWNVEIEKSDKETLYGLRRLSIWTGDVYVREPSGSGYWANIKVNFSQKHCELTIPVTINVTRVEGGM